MADVMLKRVQTANAKIETTAGTFTLPESTDALAIENLKFEYSQAREERADKIKSRGLYERYTGKIKASYTASGYLIPSGTAGTAPMLDKFLLAAFGLKTTQANTHVLYSFDGSLDQPKALSIYSRFNDFAQFGTGCYVDKLKINLDSQQPPKFEISGPAHNVFSAGVSKVSTDASENATTIAVTSGDGSRFVAGSVIKIGTDTTKYTVTAVNTDTLTISPALAADADADSAVTFYPVAGTTTGSPIPATIGLLNFNGGTLMITKATITVDNQISGIDNVMFTDTIQGVKIGGRVVTVEMSAYFKVNDLSLISKTRNFLSSEIALTVGSVAGNRFTFTMPKVEWDSLPIDTSGKEEFMIELKGKALMTGQEANDELTIKAH